MKGVRSFVLTRSSYSILDRPDLESSPSFLSLGCTSLTSTHLGLNVLCTSSSTSFLLLFKELSKKVADFSSK